MIGAARVSLAAALAGLASCGDHMLGRLIGPDEMPPKPPAVRAWEPRPVENGVTISAVYYGTKYAVVGFTDGELYLSPVGPTPSWSRLDQSPAPNIRTLPHAPVSAIAVDEDATPPLLCIGYAGNTSLHTLWARVDATSDWYDYGPPATAVDVLSLARSPFEPGRRVAVTVTQILASADAGASWGTDWVPANLGLPVSAMAEGRSPEGRRRAWFGTSQGLLYYLDGLDNGSWPTSPAEWVQIAEVFPNRPVSGIAVNPRRPEEVWVSFQTLRLDGAWRSSDYGTRWMNHHRDRLFTSESQTDGGGFGPVTAIPMLGIHYMTGVVASGSIVGFWTIDSGQTWYLSSSY